MKKHGHYCKVCGEYKANEKFSGKGHAAHICKSCASLPQEKQAEQMTINRLLNLHWRLSKEQISWLKNRMKDKHPEVRALAQKPADFDALLKLLSEMGCEVFRRGKTIRLKAPGWKNVARMDDKLGAVYSEAEIRAELAGEKQHTPRKKCGNF